MITISFYINSTGRNYSLNLPTTMFPVQSYDGRQSLAEFVVSSALRSNEYAHVVAVPMIGAELRQEGEFKDDFKLVIDAFNVMRVPATTSTFKQALLRVCTKHVNNHGRIWIADAMMYVDCAIFALQAINGWSDSQCKTFYSELASHVVTAMGDKIKRPSPFGL
jgi:hypothetical protein